MYVLFGKTKERKQLRVIYKKPFLSFSVDGKKVICGITKKRSRQNRMLRRFCPPPARRVWKIV